MADPLLRRVTDHSAAVVQIASSQPRGVKVKNRWEESRIDDGVLLVLRHKVWRPVAVQDLRRDQELPMSLSFLLDLIFKGNISEFQSTTADCRQRLRCRPAEYPIANSAQCRVGQVTSFRIPKPVAENRSAVVGPMEQTHRTFLLQAGPSRR